MSPIIKRKKCFLYTPGLLMKTYVYFEAAMHFNELQINNVIKYLICAMPASATFKLCS